MVENEVCIFQWISSVRVWEVSVGACGTELSVYELFSTRFRRISELIFLNFFEVFFFTFFCRSLIHFGLAPG